MYKKILYIVFVISFFILISAISTFAFQGGNGSINNPYNISSCIELQNMSSDKNASYQLIQDINCSGFSNFNPVGECNFSCLTINERFYGSFNGNNYQISNLEINKTWFAGLFGACSNCNISNVYLYNFTVRNSGSYSGVLIGFAGFSSGESLINNISIKNSRIFAGSRAGGLAGGFAGLSSSNISVENVTIHALSSTSSSLGGVIGYAFSDVSNMYASNILVNSSNYNITYIGGLVGRTYDDVENIYGENISLSGQNYVGGVVGIMGGGNLMNNISLINGNIISNGNYVGGITSRSYVDVSNSYFSGNIVGNNNVGGIIGQNNGGDLINNHVENSTVISQGTNNAGGLGGSVIGNIFNNSVKNVNVSSLRANQVGGIAGYVTDFVENNYITDSYIYSEANKVGGIAGYAYNFAQNNYVKNTIITGNDDVGGLFGHTDWTVISSYVYNVRITGNSSVGGLVGMGADSGSTGIYNSFFIGNITSINQSSTGSLVGRNLVYNISNSFWINTTNNPSSGVGINLGGVDNSQVENSLSYYLDESSEVYSTNWDTNIWNLSSNSLPFFQWEQDIFSIIANGEDNSESLSSVFPFGGILVALLLIISFLIFK